MGQCPSILEADDVTEVGTSRPDAATYGRRWTENIAYTIPIFYPIMTEEVFEGAPQQVESVNKIVIVDQGSSVVQSPSLTLKRQNKKRQQRV